MSELSIPGPPAAPPAVMNPPEPPVPQTLVCANCGQPLAGEFCAACGQRHEPHVHTIGHFAGEAFESISHADSRLWRTLLYLLTKPGHLTREFFAGRRVRYLPPFRLYLVISVLFFVVIGLDSADEKDVELVKLDTPEEVAKVKAFADEFEAKEEGPLTDEQRAKIAAQVRAFVAAETTGLKKTAEDGTGKEVDVMTGQGVENGISQFCADFELSDSKDKTPTNANRKSVRRWCRRFQEGGVGAIGEGIAHNIPRAMFVFLPLLALCMKLMYWRPKRYYVEHLLFMVHNHAFVFLTMALVMLVGLIPVVGDYAWLLYWAAFFYMAWYIYRAMRNVYQQSRGLTVLKYLALGCLYFVAGLSVFALTAIYSAMTF